MINSNRENKRIAIIMAEALLSHQFVLMKIYNETGDQQINGLITKIDQEIRRIKFSHENGIDWILFDDILSVELMV
ncbi:YolD-like family protein [Paenibacillus alginolyticus]|nr:YolD-like family protein [Paenibacillus alginolyticus]MEC0146729.1 YolD-like family protein [Paenibacillus alginolyticus]